MTQRGLAYFIGKGATRALFALLLFAFTSAASAGKVLVIYGPIFGPADFAVPLQAAGHTVDASNTVPASLDQYDQVWDVRLTGTDQSGTVITESQRAQYVAYLASGKKMFVVGDYSVAGPRNPSVISLIEAAGGGSLTHQDMNPLIATQTVQVPFNGPNPVTTVTFQGAGGVMSPGSGQFITLNGAAPPGVGIAFGLGTLRNATSGVLVVVFDINFTTDEWRREPEAALLANIIQYLGAPAPLPPAIANVITNVGRPYSVAVHAGHAYVADPKAHTVWKVNLTTAARTPVAGVGWKTDLDPQDLQGYNGDGIEATEAQLDNPSGVAVDAQGTLYIADTGNHAIRKIAAGANFITTVAGVPTSFAVGETARLFAPRSVAVDAAGNVYIADMMNQQIKKLDKATGLISVVVGVAGRTGRNDGTVAGADFCPPFEPAGCTAAARLNSSIGVAVDSEGIVYTADEGNNRIRKITLGGNVTTLLSSGLLKPSGIAVTPDGGTIYIADFGNHRVLRAQCNSDGCAVTTIAGVGKPGSSLGNPGDPASTLVLNSPMGVTLDGNLLYISDMMNGRIVVVNLAP